MTTDPDNKTASNAADTGRSVHLSASAGSGKTRALKERYLALLAVLDDRGLGIDQAVAITFTEKAAAEIKERVMRDLPEPMLKKIIRGRQDLRISTIHSFCMNLLKRYPLEAGLPPDFGVVDSRDQVEKIQKAIEDTLEGSDRDQELMAPLKNFTVTGLISTIEFLISIRSRLKRMEIDAGGPDGLLRSIRAGMEIDSAEAELNALINSAGWRASFQEMECLLKAAGDNYYDCMGPEHLLLSDAKHAERAFSTASALAPVYFTVDPEKIVQKQEETGIRTTLLRPSGAAVPFDGPSPARARGPRVAQHAPAVSARGRALPGIKAQRRPSGLR